jgi:hypothetical protein
MNFWAFMSKDQTMNATGKGRQEFYDQVISMAALVRLVHFISCLLI